MGSGELTASMSKVHRWIASKIEGPVRAVFLDTPAGFELNADGISRKAVEYVSRYVGAPCPVASFKSAAKATEWETKNALRKLGHADYIFAGPGSPTYAVRNLRNTPVFELVTRRLSEGAHLVLASAAAIAVGRYCLPVYEIYKVGEDPHWVDGLDMLSPYGLELAIVTHWNNTEGGAHDTRHCFMGESRFRMLEALLPASTVVLGIDEYTACVLDLASRECRVMAAGGVTVRCNGAETVFPSGSSFSLDLLRSRAAAGQEGPKPQPGPDLRERATAPAGELLLHHLEKAERMSASGAAAASLADLVSDLYELARAVDGAIEAGGEEDLISRGRASLGRLLVSGSGHISPSSADLVGGIAPFVELLIDVRSRLRAANEWALADELRGRLAALGITLEDGPAGTTWKSSTSR
jgi:hypothetical protein